jgi:septum formation protein
MDQKPLVLASGSPRRRVLLRRTGFTFTVLKPDLAEIQLAGESAIDMVTRLASRKAFRGSAESPAEAVVIGADATVVFDGRNMGKPDDPEDAVRMLLSLSEASHEAVTGYALARRGVWLDSGADSTTLRFGHIDEPQARSYVETGEPLDKAGAYAIQGLGHRSIAQIAGSFANVMGLPMERIVPLLKHHGVYAAPAGE